MKSDPWFKASYSLRFADIDLRLQVPHDVFSTQRIDEGTLLLLDHLPEKAPEQILDMGCGYGALGLPIAAKYPNAQVEMVDRDLLAVRWSKINAEENGLKNVNAHGSLGFRDLNREKKYDWVLCNVPARIGEPFINHLIDEGLARLKAGGELSVVVINDLAPAVKKLSLVAKGERHSVYSSRSASIDSVSAEGASGSRLDDELYRRDEVEVGGLKLARPFDLGGDDPKRLKVGLPILFDVLPRKPQKSVLCLRAGYGQVPLFARKRWVDAKVVAVDRDLLATAFTQMNANRLNLAGGSLEIRECVDLMSAIREGEKFDLITGELSPSAGEKVAIAEIEAASSALAQGGQAIFLCLSKLEKEWIKPYALKSKRSIQTLLAREGYSVIRVGE